MKALRHNNKNKNEVQDAVDRKLPVIQIAEETKSQLSRSVSAFDQVPKADTKTDTSGNREDGFERIDAGEDRRRSAGS